MEQKEHSVSDYPSIFEIGKEYIMGTDQEYTKPIYEVIKVVEKHPLLDTAPKGSALFSHLTSNPHHQQIL